MRNQLSKVAVAGLAGSFGIWGTTVAGYSNLNDFSLWPYQWLWWLVPAAALSALLWVYAEAPSRTPKGSPDFVLRGRGGGQWEIERLGEVTAFDLGQGDGITSGSHFGRMMTTNPLGDLKTGARLQVSMPNDSGCYVWYQWVAGGSRYFTKSVYVESGATGPTEYFFSGQPGELDQPFQT